MTEYESKLIARQLLMEKITNIDIITIMPNRYEVIDLQCRLSSGGTFGAEVKSRTKASTEYTDNYCNFNKLKDLEITYNGKGLLVSIYTDDIIKVGKIKEKYFTMMPNQPKNTYFGGQYERVTKPSISIPDKDNIFYKIVRDNDGTIITFKKIK